MLWPKVQCKGHIYSGWCPYMSEIFAQCHWDTGIVELVGIYDYDIVTFTCDWILFLWV